MGQRQGPQDAWSRLQGAQPVSTVLETHWELGAQALAVMAQGEAQVGALSREHKSPELLVAEGGPTRDNQEDEVVPPQS